MTTATRPMHRSERIKTFTQVFTEEEGFVNLIDRQVNRWLKKNPTIQIVKRHITTMDDVDRFHNIFACYIITIFYRETADKAMPDTPQHLRGGTELLDFFEKLALPTPTHLKDSYTMNE